MKDTQDRAASVNVGWLFWPAEVKVTRYAAVIRGMLGDRDHVWRAATHGRWVQNWEPSMSVGKKPFPLLEAEAP